MCQITGTCWKKIKSSQWPTALAEFWFRITWPIWNPPKIWKLFGLWIRGPKRSIFENSQRMRISRSCLFVTPKFFLKLWSYRSSKDFPWGQVPSRVIFNEVLDPAGRVWFKRVPDAAGSWQKMPSEHEHIHATMHLLTELRPCVHIPTENWLHVIVHKWAKLENKHPNIYSQYMH